MMNEHVQSKRNIETGGPRPQTEIVIVEKTKTKSFVKATDGVKYCAPNQETEAGQSFDDSRSPGEVVPL